MHPGPERRPWRAPTFRAGRPHAGGTGATRVLAQPQGATRNPRGIRSFGFTTLAATTK
jgi:hypothetical protein